MSSRSEPDTPKRPRRRLLKWSLGTLAGVIVLAAVLVGLFRVAANILPGYHDEIEQRIGVRLGAPVELGRISLNWHGWGPELEFRELRVLGSDNKEVVLSAERLSLDFTLLSLLRGMKARPYAIGLVAPKVTLQQTPDGGFVVPGLKLSASADGLGAMLASGLHAEQGQITLQFADSKKGSWVLTPIMLRIGASKSHSVELAMGLPERFGATTLHVSGEVATPVSDPSRWQWRLHYAVAGLALAPLQDFLPTAWSNLKGELMLTGTANGTGGELASASGHLGVKQLVFGDGRLARLRTHYAVAVHDGYAVTLDDAMLATADHRWEPGQIRFAHDGNGRVSIALAKFDLGLLPHLADFLPPASAKLSRRLHEMAPTGRIAGMKLAFMPGNIASLALTAELDDTSVKAAEGAPGFGHVTGKIALKHGVGIFDLDAPGLTLLMPHIFPQPVALDRASGRIGVALTATGVRVAVPELRLIGPHGLDGTMIAQVTVPNAGPVTLRLAAIQPKEVQALAARELYLPTGMLPDELDDWLLHQIQGGRVGPASMRFIGEAMKFPFKQGGGYFSVRFGVHDATLKPLKDFPLISGISGRVHFENAGMRAKVTDATIVGARLVEGSVTIPDLVSLQLEVKTEVAGQLSDFMAFLRESPIGAGVASAFDHVTTEGTARTWVDLKLPILHAVRFKLAGRFEMNDVSLHYVSWDIDLEQLSGQLRFDKHGPLSGRLDGNLFATPITIGLSRKQGKDGTTLLRLALDGDFPVATLARLARRDFGAIASGNLPLHAEVRVPLAGKGLPFSVNLTSRLKGLELKLPVPAGKSAMAELPFAARVRVGRDGIRVKARYDVVGSLCAGFAGYNTHKPPAVLELKLGKGVCTLPQDGYRIVGGWPLLKVDDWLDALPRLQESFATVPIPASAPAPASVADTGLSMPQALSLNVHFGRIDLFNNSVRDQGIRGAIAATQSRLLFDGPDLAGKVLVPSKPGNSNPILAKFTHAHFTVKRKQTVAAPSAGSAQQAAPAATRADSSAVAESNSDNGWDPRDIPPFSLHASSLRLGEAVLENVNVSARRVPNGIAIKPIRIGGGALTLNGQFVWLHPASGPQGALQFLADIHHVGWLLEALGIGPVATGNGTVTAALAWRAKKPGEFAEGLLGKVSMDLRDGNISKVNPGAGRLLSLLNLANIPRYLVFDFHSLFGEGFPFSRIYGDYHIKHGIATTKAFHIESSIADIEISGTINLVAGTMDQTADIKPNYFGSLPVIGAIVGGLGVGAAIYALTKLFGSPLSEAFKMVYSISGPITNPVVKKIGEKSADSTQPAPAAATAGAG